LIVPLAQTAVMSVEIEREFLVLPEWRPRDEGDHIRQGYIASTDGCSVRVRTRGDRAYLTVKGPTVGLSRLEFEYSIPLADAVEMLSRLCTRVIDKHRHLEVHGQHTWEIDVFHGDNDGLILAEVEMAAEDDVVTLPSWAGVEVSRDPRYRNSRLAREPFCTWTR
jgi:adenylate cyclase